MSSRAPTCSAASSPPTRIGDTVRVELTFTAAQLTRSGTRGRVTERRVVLNQDDVTVIDSQGTLPVPPPPVPAEWGTFPSGVQVIAPSHAQDLPGYETR